MTSSAPFLASGRPQIKVDGRRAERLEADLIRLEARADAAGVASPGAIFIKWGTR